MEVLSVGWRGAFLWEVLTVRFGSQTDTLAVNKQLQLYVKASTASENACAESSKLSKTIVSKKPQPYAGSFQP